MLRRLDRNDKGQIMCQICFEFFEIEELSETDCMVCGGDPKASVFCSAPCVEGRIKTDVCVPCARDERAMAGSRL